MALLGPNINAAIGQSSFEEKRPVLADSKITVTSEIATYAEWGATEIKERQAKLAELAPHVWPLKWK